MQRLHKLPLVSFNPDLTTEQSLFDDFLYMAEELFTSSIPEKYLFRDMRTLYFAGEPLISIVGIVNKEIDHNRIHMLSETDAAHLKQEEIDYYENQGYAIKDIVYPVLECQSISTSRIKVNGKESLDYIDNQVINAWYALNNYNDDDLVKNLVNGDSVMTFDLPNHDNFDIIFNTPFYQTRSKSKDEYSFPTMLRKQEEKK